MNEGKTMSTIAENLIKQLKVRGLESRLVPIRHLQDLQEKIDIEYTQGQFAEEFYQERLRFYQFHPPEQFKTAQSIIVVAMPRPQTPIKFSLDGLSVTLTLPPTYSGYNAITRQIGEVLTGILTADGFHVTPALLPLKLLAASSGLIEYGRNNIGYIPGMGSFFQLSAFFSDLPCEDTSWQEPQVMERCKTCQACLKKCPTGAITSDRFLLHAERCLVYHNERSAAYPFPAWIDTDMHNCLMGCMLCQQYCPEDKPFLGWFEECVAFSEEETSLILKGSTREELPEAAVEKLEALELIDSLDLLPRNLGIFLVPRE